MRKLTHAQIVNRQVKQLSKKRIPLVVVLNNIRSLHNVGSIFRTADGVGVEKIYLCGYTGYPPQSGIEKTALGAQQHVPWEYKESAVFVIQKLKQDGYQIILLEQIENSISHDAFKPKGPVCLVLGNEITGISEELLGLADGAIEIDMAGIKNSLNVAVAFGIVAYHIRHFLKI